MSLPVPARRRVVPRAPRPAALVAAAALACALLAGCSSDVLPVSGDGSPGDPGGPGASASPGLPTTVRPGEMVGRLPARARRATLRGVRGTVDAWVDAAYVAGPWPRGDFSEAFPGFTPGARQRAYGDARLLSNAGIGARVDGVRATQRRVVVDVLARGGRAEAATARVTLAFRTTGEVRRAFRVRGRLFLTRTPGGWRVFGYDLTKGSRR